MKISSHFQLLVELGLVTLFLQICASNFAPVGWTPQVTVLFVLFIAFYQASPLSVMATFLVGLFSDMAAGGHLGPSSAALVATHAVVSVLARRLFLDAAVSAILFGGLATLFATLVRSLLLSQFTTYAWDTSLLYEVMMTALVAPIFLWIFRFIAGKRLKLFLH